MIKLEIRDKREPGWTWINNEILTDFAPIIKDSGIAVYIALCSFADNDNQTAYPSHATIGRRSGKSARAIPAALDRLVDAGLIHVKSRKSEGLPNLYTLLKVRSAKIADPGLPKLQTGSAKIADELDPDNKTENNVDVSPRPRKTHTLSDEQGWQAFEKKLADKTELPQLSQEQAAECAAAQIAAGMELKHAIAIEAEYYDRPGLLITILRNTPAQVTRGCECKSCLKIAKSRPAKVGGRKVIALETPELSPTEQAQKEKILAGQRRLVKNE